MNAEFVEAAKKFDAHNMRQLKDVLLNLKTMRENLARKPTPPTAILNQIPKIELGAFPDMPEIKEWDGQKRQMGAQNGLLACLIEAFLNPDFLRMAVVVVCSIALAPAIKCKFFKLLVLATFVSFALLNLSDFNFQFFSDWHCTLVSDDEYSANCGLGRLLQQCCCNERISRSSPRIENAISTIANNKNKKRLLPPVPTNSGSGNGQSIKTVARNLKTIEINFKDVSRISKSTAKSLCLSLRSCFQTKVSFKF